MSDNSSTTAPFNKDGGDIANEPSAETAEDSLVFHGRNEEAREVRFERLSDDWEGEENQREYLGKNGLDTLACRLLYASSEEAAAILDQIIASASLVDPDDDQPKCELVDFVPHLAGQLANDAVAWPRLKPLFNSHLLRIIESALQYPSPRVVKAGHAALLRLLENGLIQNDVLEQRIWPILLDKIGHMPDTDATLSTIHLMSKMTAWLGDDQTERVVVPALDQMSSDPNFAVRRVCAQLYGDFCAVVSITCAEKLVPAFLRLCKDIEWVVRKTCAEVFMSVSSTVSLETRKLELAPAFEKLLKDRVRWVYLAAYQSLGPFITTFADPSITILGYNHLGELVLKHPDGFESKSQTDNRGADVEDLDDGDSRFRNNSWRSMQDDKDKDSFLIGNSSRRMYLRALDLDGDGYFVDNSRKGKTKNGVEPNFEENREEETMEEVGEAILVLGNWDDDEIVEEEIVDEEEVEDQEDNALQGIEQVDNVPEEVDEDVVIDHIEEVEASSDWMVYDGKDENFNTFQFWREPLPNIDTELEEKTPEQFGFSQTEKPQFDDPEISKRARKRRYKCKVSKFYRECTRRDTESVLNNNPLENISLKPANMLGPPHTPKSQDDVGEVNLANKSTLPKPYLPDSERAIMHCERQMHHEQEMHQRQRLKEAMNSPPQDVVPQELIKHFVSMSKLAMDEDYGNDLAHHCAYNLPAVVLTLGPQHWDLLKPAYKALAEALHWKVRRTAASSIHELAVIVGEEVATEDLVPVFHGFIKDLDEVRVAALKHLAHFLKLLRPDGRDSFLPLLTQFLMMDNQWRWRFRQELAEQLLQVLGLFSPADTCQHLSPVVMSLLLDRVSDVRKIALQLATELVSHVSIDVSLLRSLLAELAEQFAHSSRWNRRQTFSLFCSRLVAEGVLSGEMFARDVLPHLLDLSWDRVPNVRLTVARALANDLMTQPYFTDVNCPHHEVLVAVLKRLQTDKDKDVRYFASQVPANLQTQFNVNEQNQTKIRSSSDAEVETKNL
uniref:Serine/threonine-protein phosphatase 4 regulatory subunit 1 n=2 Tax=Lygus hesperus TaxID=30085 RepID=A0A0A9XLJ4_LYGHE